MVLMGKGEEERVSRGMMSWLALGGKKEEEIEHGSRICTRSLDSFCQSTGTHQWWPMKELETWELAVGWTATRRDLTKADLAMEELRDCIGVTGADGHSALRDYASCPGPCRGSSEHCSHTKMGSVESFHVQQMKQLAGREVVNKTALQIHAGSANANCPGSDKTSVSLCNWAAVKNRSHLRGS